MKTGKTMYQFETFVMAPRSEVENILFDISSGHYVKNLPILLSEVGPVVIIQQNQIFLVRYPDSEQKMKIHIDHNNHTLTMEGQWWYQGVYTLEENKNGTLIQLKVNNVASRLSQWIVPFISWGKKKYFQNNFNDLVHRLKSEFEL